MNRTVCVLTLVALCAGLTHSFSWEFVRGVDHRLDFIEIDGSISHTESVTADTIRRPTYYNPVNNRMLFNDLHAIFSFDITTKKTECLMRTTNATVIINSMAYDPATELLVWLEDSKEIYTLTLKPEFNKNEVNEKKLILSEQSISNYIFAIAVDSCGGFIYFMSYNKLIKVRFNGSEKEEVLDNGRFINSFTIDQLAQKLYFTDDGPSIKTADLNGKNIRTIFVPTKTAFSITVTKDFMYWLSYNDLNRKYTIRQVPKNLPLGTDVVPKHFTDSDRFWNVVIYCNISDITPQEIQNCDNLKSLQPKDSVSTDVSLLCVHGTKVDGESRCECTQGYSGERCEVSVCHNYCLYGNCSTSAEGLPKCSCNAGYVGNRCEMNLCLGYCLNGGLCSLSEEDKPLCQCTGHYEGQRCDVSVF